MSETQDEPIIALATPPGTSALATIRLSGKDCHLAIQKLSDKLPPLRRASHCHLTHNGTHLDDVVITLWKTPHSYTGEDMAEISCHGNPLIIDRIIRATDFRMAQPGEFTQRAFLNGKLDLTQAEAVLDIIHARSERSLAAAQRIKKGHLGQQLLLHRETLLQTLSHLEAYIDFPDEDIEPDTGQHLRDQIQTLHTAITSLLRTAEEGRRLREGVEVVLAGAPNAGKSSLLNALLGHDRAIVSDTPGTTRDTIEASLLIDGIQVRLIDTAGLHESHDTLENLGIERTLTALREADLILHLIDSTHPAPPATALPPGTPSLTCLTKCDLPPHDAPFPRDTLHLSSKTGNGLDTLRHRISSTLSLSESLISNELVAINTRHETCLEHASHSLTEALARFDEQAPPEVIASDLRHALHAIGEIVGQTTNEDMLDRLFQSFCIGK